MTDEEFIERVLAVAPPLSDDLKAKITQAFNCTEVVAPCAR